MSRKYLKALLPDDVGERRRVLGVDARVGAAAADDLSQIFADITRVAGALSDDNEAAASIRLLIERATDMLSCLDQKRERESDPSVSVSAVVSNARGLLQLVAGEGVTIEIAPSDGDLVASVSELDVVRSLMNLVANARDRGARKVAIRARRIMGHGSGVRLASPGFVRVSVSDDGTEMSERFAEAAFAPYVTDTTDGSGLALATAHEVVTAAGGRVRLARSAGTVFLLDLPERRQSRPGAGR